MKNYPSQAFNKHNALYQIVHNYCVSNNIALGVIQPENVSKNVVRKYLHQNGAIVSSKKTTDDTYKIKDNDFVEVPSLGIKFICKRNTTIDETQPKENNEPESKSKISEPVLEDESDQSKIDLRIRTLIHQSIGAKSIDDILSHETKKSFCAIIELFEIIPFEEVRSCELGTQLVNFVTTTFTNSNLPREIDFDKKKFAFSGLIIKSVVTAKLEKEKEFNLLFDELTSGLYDNSLNKFHQNYNKGIIKESFLYLVGPLLDSKLVSRIAIENLTKPITQALLLADPQEKYLYYDNNKGIYENYLNSFEQADAYTKQFLGSVPAYLFKFFKTICNTVDERTAALAVRPTSKKYNFQNSERSTHDIFLFVSNEGDGLAKNIKLFSLSSLHFLFAEVEVGILKPREKREVTLSCQINHDEFFLPQLNLLITWEEMSGQIERKECSVTFEQQELNIPWDQLSRQSPYSIQIIEDRHKLFGRDEIIEELKRNVLSDNIESYKIWGQKRVGKSSIVKTLKSLFKDSENILVIYRSILGLRNPDPVKTLNDLGESVCSEILAEIENKIKNPLTRENLRNVAIPSFDGSFYPLDKFINKLHSIDPHLKFVFIIDEFDRINEDFFRATDLGEGFSGSIGKALNEKNYIGFVLVGSENMQLLDRQGMNYNSYLEREVDTFKKETEYDSFKNIVLGPVNPHIIFSEDAIDRIFDVTNGNPYFTNLICKEVFKTALKNRDSYVDIHLADTAIDLICKSSQKSHFEHFWGDGLTEETDVRRDRTADIRRRILVSFSISSKPSANQYPNKSDILKSFKYPEEYSIEKYEVENTITEFFNRKIFYNENTSIRIKPLLFEKWLCGPGKTLMIEGVSDLEALHREIELETEYALKDEELKRLSDNLVFADQSLSTKRFKEYFEQFGSSIEQRKVFKLLDSIFYISKEELNEFFRREQKNIFTKKKIALKEHAHIVYRDGVEIYCFSGTFEENITLVDSFKVMNRIRSTKTIKNIRTESDYWKKSDATDIIIIEPIIDGTDGIIDELIHFITPELIAKNVSVRLVSFLSTTKAKTSLVKVTSSFPNFKLIVYKEVEETKIKPFIKETEIFESLDEANQAFAAVRKKIPVINRESLLVLFDGLCPSKSCPILWYDSPQFKPIFFNEFAKLETVQSEEKNSEDRRTRLFHAYRELAQKMNYHIVDFLKAKAVSEGKPDWFIVNYVPKSVLQSVSQKWIDEGTANPKESYFDFLDYKKIIEHNKELTPTFTLSGEGIAWCDKLNVLRRDPAHPEKPAPTEKEVLYFEKIKDQILTRLN